MRKKFIPIPSPAIPMIVTEAWAKQQIKATLEANFRANPVDLREAAERLIKCVPPSDAKLQLILIAKGEIEPSIDALVDGLIEGWGGVNHV
jgi:hypothetical protein